MKKILVLLLVLTMCVTTTSLASSNKNIRVPETFSINRIDVATGESIDKPIETYNDTIGIRTLLGYNYIDGTAYLGSRSYDKTFAYIWGTSVTFVDGAEPTYTLKVSREETKETSWTVGAKAKFNIKVVETEVQGSYSSKDTATIYKGETWDCKFTKPGSYDLTWYMRGHHYPVYGKAKIVSTGSDNGDVTTVKLGTVTFPTEEVAFDVSD